jgi:hypothetical protein
MFAPSHFLQQFLVYVLLFFYGVNSSREGKEASCIFLLPTEYWKKVGLETTWIYVQSLNVSVPPRFLC